VLSSAGLIGLTGVNSAGMAICVNTLLMLRPNPDGLPVAAVMRHALAQRSVAEAQAVLETVPHASGQHYAIADRSGVLGFECSKDGCIPTSRVRPTILTHTNHPLVSADVESGTLAILSSRGRVADSKKRLAYLDAWIASGGSADDVLALLTDPGAPICVSATPERPGQTFGSVMFQLEDKVEASFCLGKAGQAPWESIPFETLSRVNA